jgi:hypothetical protein
MGVWRRNRNRGQGTRPWSCVGAVGPVGCCCWSFLRLWGYVYVYGLPGVQGKAPAAAAAAAGNAGPGVGSWQGWPGRCTPERLRIAIGFNLVLQQLQQKWQSARTSHIYGWTGHKSSSGFSDLAPSILHYNCGSETTFLSALCVIRPPSYSLWSRTFFLGVGLTDLGHFGRYFGQNEEIVYVFNGSVVYSNVGIGLTSFGMSCSTRQELHFQLFV